MDRRSWLWRRKSSEKSPGETESSVSSHSERFSDDQIYSNQSFESPEVTSKAELQQEELEDGVKALLSQKLSEALLNISIKEDLVKQHSKVAEEAVEGWEKAEKEVLALRQQVEVLTLRNSTLEDRVGHLDGALKECLRQLRQTREENDEVIEKKTSEWQRTKAELEKQVSDLRSQLQNEPSLTSIEKQNSALKLELASMAEELELRFIEKELSNQAAEQASKLHLESAKKAAKFEAECRRLNVALKKALASNSSQSVVESNGPTPAKEQINLMDDFLEMERLVALPKSDPRDSLQNRISEVEEALKRVEMEKQNMEIALIERENELKTSRNELKVSESKLIKANEARETTKKEVESLKTTIHVLQERLKRSEQEVVELIRKVDSLEIEVGNERALSGKLGAKCQELEGEKKMLNLNVISLQTEVEKERVLSGKLGAKCKELEGELESLVLKVDSLETEVGNERALSGKLGAKCHELEGEKDSLNLNVISLQTEVEKERALSGKLGAKCKELEGEMESVILKVDSLEKEVEKERALSKKMGVKSQELEGEMARLQRENMYPKPAIQNPINQDAELALAGGKFADCQKTIASLSRQLKTLAALEDFLADMRPENDGKVAC